MRSLVAGEKVVGMAANLAPYHHARWQAFAESSPVACVIAELTNKDAFPVMEFSSTTGASFTRRTLFPGKLESELAAKEIGRRIFALLDEERPTCVCLSGYATPLSLAALGWCLRHGVPSVMMSESTAWDEPRKGWKERIKSRVVRCSASAFVGGSPHVEYMAQLGMPRERIFTGYDVVDNGHFEKKTSLTWEDGSRTDLPEKYFMASARFVPKKNLARLLRAYARYLELAPGETPVWDLVLLGDGPEREALLRLRSELGLEARVHFVGARAYGELPFYYEKASAFVHASTTEQWGLVVNEAMASGLPVLISNRCGCAQDLLQEGVNGFSFDPYDVEEMARRMLELTGSTARLEVFGEESRRVIANWSPRRFAEGLAGAVECALAEPRPAPAWSDRVLVRFLRGRF